MLGDGKNKEKKLTCSQELRGLQIFKANNRGE